MTLGLPVVEPSVVVLIHEVLPVVSDVDAAAHAADVVKLIAGVLIDIAGLVIVGWRHIGFSALVSAPCASVLLQLRIPYVLHSRRHQTLDNTCRGGEVSTYGCVQHNSAGTVVPPGLSQGVGQREAYQGWGYWTVTWLHIGGTVVKCSSVNLVHTSRVPYTVAQLQLGTECLSFQVCL